MSKCLSNNLSEMQESQPAILAAKELLAHAMAPVYRVVNGILVVSVFVVVGLWLSGNGTNAGAFDLARLLVPDEARHMVWSNGFGMLDQYKESQQTADSQSTNSANVVGINSVKQQTVALLMPSVAQLQVKSISHLADRIPNSKMDPLALDNNLMGSIHNQRAIADFYEKKYSLDRAKIEEYHKARVDSIAAEIVRSTVQKMYPGYAKGGAAAGRIAAKDVKTEAVAKTDVVAKTATAAGKATYVAAKPAWESIDWDKDPKQLLYITGKAYLKGKGTLVTWRK